mmetsp:Transcript_17733/g.29314  ORF Transcript_17733/g.29314 Transcript_17733/m.29314 type:complete len:225 (+) Transcript_17733:462-1136(+)
MLAQDTFYSSLHLFHQRLSRVLKLRSSNNSSYNVLVLDGGSLSEIVNDCLSLRLCSCGGAIRVFPYARVEVRLHRLLRRRGSIPLDLPSIGIQHGPLHQLQDSYPLDHLINACSLCFQVTFNLCTKGIPINLHLLRPGFKLVIEQIECRNVTLQICFLFHQNLQSFHQYTFGYAQRIQEFGLDFCFCREGFLEKGFKDCKVASFPQCSLIAVVLHRRRHHQLTR